MDLSILLVILFILIVIIFRSKKRKLYLPQYNKDIILKQGSSGYGIAEFISLKEEKNNIINQLNIWESDIDKYNADILIKKNEISSNLKAIDQLTLELEEINNAINDQENLTPKRKINLHDTVKPLLIFTIFVDKIYNYIHAKVLSDLSIIIFIIILYDKTNVS